MNIVLERSSFLLLNLGVSQPLSCLTHESLSNTQTDLMSWKPFAWCYSKWSLFRVLLTHTFLFTLQVCEVFVMMRFCDFQLVAHLPSFLLSPLQSDDMVIFLLSGSYYYDFYLLTVVCDACYCFLS